MFSTWARWWPMNQHWCLFGSIFSNEHDNPLTFYSTIYNMTVVHMVLSKYLLISMEGGERPPGRSSKLTSSRMPILSAILHVCVCVCEWMYNISLNLTKYHHISKPFTNSHWISPSFTLSLKIYQISDNISPNVMKSHHISTHITISHTLHGLVPPDTLCKYM